MPVTYCLFIHSLQSSHWIGTIILSTCELIERPSKKDGFCFKLFHPMDQSIWASRGPAGEAIGAVVQPLPTSHLIFRAPNNAAGKCWMDALELALRCSSLLLRTMSSNAAGGAVKPSASSGAPQLASMMADAVAESLGNANGSGAGLGVGLGGAGVSANDSSALNESDIENHFKSGG